MADACVLALMNGGSLPANLNPAGNKRMHQELARRGVPLNRMLQKPNRVHIGVAIASGQKTTLSQCGIGMSQRAKTFAMNLPAGRVANWSTLRGARVGFLLSEVDLPRFGVLDPRIIRSLARFKPPITSIIRTVRE